MCVFIVVVVAAVVVVNVVVTVSANDDVDDTAAVSDDANQYKFLYFKLGFLCVLTSFALVFFRSQSHPQLR